MPDGGSSRSAVDDGFLEARKRGPHEGSASAVHPTRLVFAGHVLPACGVREPLGVRVAPGQGKPPQGPERRPAVPLAGLAVRFVPEKTPSNSAVVPLLGELSPVPVRDHGHGAVFERTAPRRRLQPAHVRHQALARAKANHRGGDAAVLVVHGHELRGARVFSPRPDCLPVRPWP